MTKPKSMEKERIPLLAVYRHDGKLVLRVNEREASIFELYGFLDLWLTNLKEELIDQMETDNDE